jgi:hypothetical protein
MNIYLDVDGVLLDKKGKLMPGAIKLVKKLVDERDVYWLTTWCKDGNADKVIEVLSKEFPKESIKYLKKIKPTKWSTWKTEAIDFSKDFRWIEDYVFPEEDKVLNKNKAQHKVKLIYNNLENFVEHINVHIGTEEEIVNEMKRVTKSPIEPKLETKIIMGHVDTGKYAYLQHLIHKYHKTCKFVLIDGDKLHFAFYRGFSFVLGPIVDLHTTHFELFEDWLTTIINTKKRKKKYKDEKVIILISQYTSAMSRCREKTEKAFIKIAKEGKELGIYLVATTSRGEDKNVITDEMKKHMKVENFDNYKNENN